MSIVQANVASLRPWFLKAMCFLLRKPQIAICFLRRMKIGRLLPHLLLCLLSVSPAFPQAGQGGITGLVTDSSGAVIQAAKVQARNVSTGAAFQTVTTQAGLYSFVALPPSHYDVTVTGGRF
jgi:Carboxypeptidase regulatory-like domain